MLHAAAMAGALIVIWLAATQRASSPQDWAVAAGVALLCVMFAARFGGLSDAFARTPRLAAVYLTRAGAVGNGVASTLRAAISADVVMNPTLVRIRSRARSADRASFAALITASPGTAVVSEDADGLLVHVIDEGAIDPIDLARIEQSVASGGQP